MAGGKPGLLRLRQQFPVFGSQLGQPASEVFDAFCQPLRRALLRVVCVPQGGEGGHGGGVQRLDRAAAFRQFAQAAVGVTGVQGGQVGPGGLFLFAQGLQPALRLLLLRPQLVRPLCGVSGSPAPLREDTQLVAHSLRGGAQDSGQVAAVTGEERAQGRIGALQAAEFVPYGVEVVEVARHLLDHVLVEPRQGLAEQGGQAPVFDAVPDRRTPQPVEELGEVAVARRVGDAEQFPGHPRAVQDRTVGDVVGADDLLEPVDRQGLPPFDQVQVLTDAQRGDEERRQRLLRRLRGTDGGTERQVAVTAVVGRSPELDPQVPETVGLVEPVQHQPGECGAAGACGVQCPGVAVQKIREQHLQGLGLARAVLAAQQQPSVAEGELLRVVLPDVLDARPVQPEAGAGGRRGPGTRQGNEATRVGGHSGNSF
ncbi:hypothetical protein RB196_01805 [Streptomyces sp. PmtA]|uniref:hypothetical protein n=1 Tax=Streptomyces sp. PmtA TaxID=3074275 RepID=UPI003014C746